MDENQHAIEAIYNNLKRAEDWDRDELISFALTYLKDNIDALNAEDDDDTFKIDEKYEQYMWVRCSYLKTY